MSIDSSPSLHQHFLDPALPEILIYKSVICLCDDDILHKYFDQLLFVVKPETIFASLQKKLSTSSCAAKCGSVVGFKTGNPRVGCSHTVPEPVYTVYPQRVIPSRPVIHAVSNETRSITDTRSFFYLSQLLFIKIIKIF